VRGREQVRIWSSIFDFIRGTNGSPPVRDITAEDLLGRKPVEIDLNQCRNSLYLPCELYMSIVSNASPLINLARKK
jgi:hypothetical protein